MSGRLRKTREGVVERLAPALSRSFREHSHAWNVSKQFRSPLAKHPFESPLETVKFNPKTLRYESSHNKIKDDDFIAQALVMLNLASLEHGWGWGTTMKQLSVWAWKPSEEKPNDILPNLWKEEIDTLIETKKLGKNTLGHFDNYDAIKGFYRGTNSGERKDCRWNRRSNAMLSNVHVLVEQAAVQWALEQMEQDPHYASLATILIRLFLQVTNLKEGLELQDLMLKAANEADVSSDNFCKILMKKLESDGSEEDKSSSASLVTPEDNKVSRKKAAAQQNVAGGGNKKASKLRRVA